MASSIEQQHPQTPGVPPTSRLRLKFWGITTTLTLSDPVPLSTSGSSVDVQEYRTQLWLSTPGNERGILAASIPITYSQLLPAGEKFPGEGEPAKNREWVARVRKVLTWQRIEKAVWSLVLLGLIAPLIILFVAFVQHLSSNTSSIQSNSDIPMTILRGSIFFSHAMLTQLSSNGFYSHPELGYIPNACHFSSEDWRKLIVDLPFQDTISVEDSFYYGGNPESIRYDYRRYAIGDNVDVTLDLQDDPKFTEAWLELVPRNGRSVNATAMWKAGNTSFSIGKSGWAEMPGRSGEDGLWPSDVVVRIRDMYASDRERYRNINLGKLKVNGTAPVVDLAKTAQQCPAGTHCKVAIPLSPNDCIGVVLSPDTALRRHHRVGDRYYPGSRHSALVIYSPRWATVIPAAALIWGAVLTLLGLVVALWRWEKVPSDKVRAWVDRRREGRIALPTGEEATEPLLGA
ncbi:hypothetical protein HDU96_009776 [Phlyctochytrium bullatum]|nr:hypothetical protein HDU96_009776 [Phlyctochytrium bullatum]